jgi:hypothetical protein
MARIAVYLEILDDEARIEGCKTLEDSVHEAMCNLIHEGEVGAKGLTWLQGHVTDILAENRPVEGFLPESKTELRSENMNKMGNTCVWTVSFIREDDMSDPHNCAPVAVCAIEQEAMDWASEYMNSHKEEFLDGDVEDSNPKTNWTRSNLTTDHYHVWVAQTMNTLVALSHVLAYNVKVA